MRLYILTIVFTSFFVCMAPSAHAKVLLDWVFTPKIKDQTRVLLQDGKRPHRHAYAKKEPGLAEHWAHERGGIEQLIADFYHDGILTDQDLDEDIPEFEVGRTFMQLSSIDKRRIAEVLDYAYNITNKADGPGAFVLIHGHSCDTIGVYTRLGLQLQ